MKILIVFSDSKLFERSVGLSHRHPSGLEPEQDVQSYTEGGDYGVDDTMLCEADHAQERFVMENDGDQSVDSDISGDDVITEENGHDEVICASSI